MPLLPCHDQTRDIVKYSSTDQHCTDLGLGEIETLRCAVDDNKCGTERRRRKSCADNENFHGTYSMFSEQIAEKQIFAET